MIGKAGSEHVGEGDEGRRGERRKVRHAGEAREVLEVGCEG
jgi:hypothetical protein